ncbi:retrotransposon hot spot (RHS) protein, putative [Trypanosoma cruzi]|uniref:Retrotransposon hot spot (RHS) protein, putative n=1 Tax=Trypanosoma cruzi (strain CL Brener) TaxID=353153 RepID=Q4DQ78_TRYCC|nr:retrotransposon hot spot (RHS) protein, putative [Trypanosoma cruzi]EAN94683.1 retrotransposon hot spot (RHS) protein, putative [Trypanosoma cruzi]|eukprot:XP_816534.1 retrotransposon hot spot (RHS) protein [Trypanosoma cruzi strain CL Brener]
MSGRPESVQGGNVEIRVPTVPQGDCRKRTRPESYTDTYHPAATCGGVGKRQQTKWTLDSRVEDVLLGGKDRITSMGLNEFLCNFLGGRGVVDANEDVSMEMFLTNPMLFSNGETLSCTLAEFPLCRAMKMLLEAAYTLKGEGVFLLAQWRNFEGKDTVTPIAKGALDAALLLWREEAEREAEKRARRKAKERTRQKQQIKITLSTNIEDVLLRGRVRAKNMKLNDFLTVELGGRGVVDANRNVLLEEFVRDPERYIGDEGLLNEIKTLYNYVRMEIAVRKEMTFCEDLRSLCDKGVDNLLKWSEAAAEVKASVNGITKHTLDAALVDVRNPKTTSAPIYLEGLYESVYNARWHHVVEVPGGEGTGLEVREGEPAQPWTYKAVGDTFEKNNGVEQSGAAPSRLMVLTSDKGWPYSWKWEEHKFIHDCYVNSEVDRVWQIVKGDLTEWFSSHGRTEFTPKKRVLIGTPGIGKSMAASSYLLYQLLHYDIKKLRVVVHCFGATAYVFNKTIQTVTKCEGNEISKIVLYGLWQRGIKGYIIYDVTWQETPPASYFASFREWGMIVVSSPNLDNYDGWATQVRAERIIMNCPDEMDVKAMCAWMKRDETKKKQAECWKMVEERMEKVGPLPQHIFRAEDFKARFGAVENALEAINSRYADSRFILPGRGLWYSKDPSEKLVRIVRIRGEVGLERFRNAPICYFLGSRSANILAKAMSEKGFLLLVLGSRKTISSACTDRFCLHALILDGFVSAMAEELKELRPPAHDIQDTVMKANPVAHPTEICEIPGVEGINEKQNINYQVLYMPVARDFPLVDCFFFVESPRRTLVGLRMTTAGEHHTTTSTVWQFTQYLSEFFNGWGEFSQGLSWEIIYVQDADGTPMNDWQRCDVVDPPSVGDVDHERIAEFWETTHQYQFALTECFLRRML